MTKKEIKEIVESNPALEQKIIDKLRTDYIDMSFIYIDSIVQDEHLIEIFYELIEIYEQFKKNELK